MTPSHSKLPQLPLPLGGLSLLPFLAVLNQPVLFLSHHYCLLIIPWSPGSSHHSRSPLLFVCPPLLSPLSPYPQPRSLLPQFFAPLPEVRRGLPEGFDARYLLSWHRLRLRPS